MMRGCLGLIALVGALASVGCGGEGGNATVSGGTCPTCSSGGTPSVTSACSNESKRLASGPTKSGSGSGGTPTTTTTTTTTGTPFAAPTTNVNVNTPPSSSVSINCGSGTTP
jgi:hypothetical protein